MDMRVFWAVLASAAVLLLVQLVGTEIRQRREQAALAEAWAGVVRAANAPDPMGLQALTAQRERQRQLQAASDWRRRELAGNQRCVGGVVVVVDGVTYTQLGTVGDPVRCQGHYADRPIR